MKILWYGVLVLFAFPASAQDWKVDYGRSELRFVIKQMNVPVEGGFGKFAVSAAFDAAKPELGKFRVEVDVASIDTGSEDGNGEVKRPAWFDAARYPKALFVSKSISKDGPGSYTLTGDMMVKSHTKSIAVPLILMPQRDGGWLASGRFALKRTDFDIGGGEWADPSVVAEVVDGRFKIFLRP